MNNAFSKTPKAPNPPGATLRDQDRSNPPRGSGGPGASGSQRGSTAAQPPRSRPGSTATTATGKSGKPTINELPPARASLSGSEDPSSSSSTAGNPQLKTVGPFAFWDSYFKTHAETPEQVGEKVALLRKESKFDHIEAILWNYLKHHPREAKSWMYQGLAVAMDINRRDPAKVKTALSYAADLALASEDVAAMVMVAELMYARGIRNDETIIRLIDTARTKGPLLAAPKLMSLTLAVETLDPERMVATVEELLSVGWPLVDEAIRKKAREKAEALAEQLDKAGSSDAAHRVRSRLARSEARDLVIRLTWDGDADLDLIVEEPDGGQATMLTPCTILGGSILNNGYGKNPEEFYVCPRAVPGRYRIKLDQIYNNPNNLATRATLEIIHNEGLPTERKSTVVVELVADGTTKPKPVEVVVRPEEGRRTQLLPYAGLLAEQQKFAETLLKTLAAPGSEPPKKEDK
ncbi:hypothetical protein Isop_0967 [Isosphaera pallida ATCC 43644]|uniref:DUF2135 domain-containing protein n=1 Tax=Isosphaera pallida (strain ATCC 43644 / DSM 9630 / IS1B) TaxID=575540 RepID=E8R3I9_ISOPI|nr:hypothetical protein Isop_0967 [Isosphaera pallida ATCC 43644]